MRSSLRLGALVAAVVAACEPSPTRGPEDAGGGSTLDGASLDGASLDGASLDGASLDGASLDGASLDGASLDGASLDARGMDTWGGDASWGACSVGGVSGTCIDMSLCTGDRMPVMGFCPGPAAIQCCVPRADGGPVSDGGPRPDGGACDPAERPLPNVGLVEAAGEGGCPSGMVPVTADVCIDRYEASLVEVLSDGSTREWSPFHHPGGRRVRALSRAGAIPQGYVDGLTAAAACSEAGKRLCSDSEWLRACQGSAGTTYPYGTARMTGVCNDHRDRHPAVERFGTSADWIWSRLGDACINQLPMSVAPTGAYVGCVSEPGALDMMGNLHEWTSDPLGTFRGGFYVDTVINGNGCLYRTTAHDRGHWDYSTGFRCCADR